MSAELISIVATVIAILAVAYAFYARKQPVTAAGVLTAIREVPSVVTEVEKAATIVVQSIEQSRRKGKVENTPSLNEVMNQVRGWLPAAINIEATNDQIVGAINSAILVASEISNSIAASKRTG